MVTKFKKKKKKVDTYLKGVYEIHFSKFPVKVIDILVCLW